jgi:5-methylcytosine-specific restriction enzyme subunit McrC
MAHRAESLLDLFIVHFADRLLAEVRHGLPRQYRAQEDDLRALRGRLDIVRQFTAHAVRPDRLACRFDMLDADTPLLRIMKACVVLLARHSRAQETQRKLAELRFLLAGVRDVPRRDLPWTEVRIDRTNGRWRTLLALAKLLLGQHWQQTHADARQPEGITLLFPMHELFERYVTVQARRALTPLGLEVVAQGGFENCLGEWRSGEVCRGRVFRTRPDILVRRHGKVLAVVDMKWKALSADPLDRRHGVSQADVYQLMAYARLYRCDRLLLLYPAAHGDVHGKVHPHGIAHGHERLDIATISLEAGAIATQERLRELISSDAFAEIRTRPEESGAFLGAF